MSNSVLPALAGLRFPATRTPIWSTKVQQAVSGDETRIGYWSTPRWRWTIGYEMLRNTGGFTDLQQLVGFYNARGGQYDSWLFTDPDDSVATSQLFGTGDGTTVSFQLARTLGGFSEPVRAVNVLTGISMTDFQGTRTLSVSTHSNYTTYSEQFDNAAWAKLNTASIVANGGVAPDGTSSADQANFSGNTGAALWQDTTTAAVASTTYTFSLWLFGTSGQTVTLGISTTTGVGGSANNTVTLGSGWNRYSVSLTTAGAVSGNMRVRIERNITGTALSFYPWGAQLEPVASASPYIKTVAAGLAGPDYSVDALGMVTLISPPALAATLSWTGTFYWRVRWDDMDFEMEKLMSGFWSSADLSFTSLKL